MATGNRSDNSSWNKQRFQQPESPSRTSQHPVPVPSYFYYAHQLLPLARVTLCWWSGTPLNGGDNSGWSFEHGYVCSGQYPPDQRHPNKRVNPSLVCRWLQRSRFLACSQAMVGQAHNARPQVRLLSESCQNSCTCEGGKDVRSHHHVPKFWHYHHVWRPTLPRHSPWRRWLPKPVHISKNLSMGERSGETSTDCQDSASASLCYLHTWLDWVLGLLHKGFCNFIGATSTVGNCNPATSSSCLDWATITWRWFTQAAASPCSPWRNRSYRPDGPSREAVSRFARDVLSGTLVRLITDQGGDVLAALSEQVGIKQKLEKKRAASLQAEALLTTSTLPPSLQRCATAAQEKGTSAWLTAVLLERHGFALHKGEY